MSKTNPLRNPIASFLISRGNMQNLLVKLYMIET